MSRIRVIATMFLLAGTAFISAGFKPARVSAEPRKSEVAGMHLLHHALYLADLYNWAAAEPYFQEARRMFAAAGDQRNTLYARLGDIRSRAERLNLPATSAQLARELDANPFLRTDKQLRMFCLIVKGDIDGEVDAVEMRDDWQQVEALARESGNTRWQYRALAQLGMAAFYAGDLPTARQDVGTSLAEAEAAHDAGAQVRYLTVLGIGLVESKMYSQALSYFTHALEIARSTPDAGYPFVTQQARLQALIGLGQLTAAQRLDAEFLAQAQKGRQPGQEAVALVFASTVAADRNESETALSDLKKALAISKPAGYLRQVSQEQAQLAGLYRKLGSLKEAELFAKLAAASAQAGGDIWSVPERLRILAEIKTAERDYAQADRIYDRAEAFIDSSVAGASGALDKTAFIRASSLLYAEHFCLVAQQFNDPAKAFSIIEQVRGRVATDLLMVGSRTPEEAVEDERELSALRLKLMSARSTARVRAIRNEIFMAEQARWVTPDLSILKARSREALGIKRVQATLNASTLLLEYVTSEPRSYCLAISRKQVRIIPLAGEDHISRLIEAYRRDVKAQRTADKEGRQLYNILLHPISEVQRDQVLVIVRDGPLYLIPFDGLVDSSGRYVVDKHTIVYEPSATAYCLLTQEEQNPATFHHQLLAVGGISYNSTELRQASLTRGYEGNDVSLLPGSRQEVLEAAAAIHDPSNTLLLGSEATKYAFEHERLAQYRIIHLAVHAFADPEDPSQSSLVLLSDPSANEDGFLEASEIVQLRIRAELVILSACDTAVGPVEGEEGIATLARAFLLAGARSVISTLWSIDDNDSFMLMKLYYKHLASGEPAAYALAEAKRDLLRAWGQNAVPYFWAGYIFEGPLGR